MHTRAHGGWLSGILPKRTEGADLLAGKTIDQYAADKLSAETSLRSLELTTDTNFRVGNCENVSPSAYASVTASNASSLAPRALTRVEDPDPGRHHQRRGTLFGGHLGVGAMVG